MADLAPDVRPDPPRDEVPANSRDLADVDVAWHVVARIEEIEGERRAAILRAVAIAVFYGVEAAANRGLDLGILDLSYARSAEVQRAISALCGAWLIGAATVFALIRMRWAPPALKYVSTVGDVLFLTAILAITEGPGSPMVVGYFLVIALSALRMSLPLVRVATTAAALGYVALLGFAKWFPGARGTVPRYHQVVFVLALVLCGVLVGQVVRRAKTIARAYAARRRDEEGGSP